MKAKEISTSGGGGEVDNDKRRRRRSSRKPRGDLDSGVMKSRVEDTIPHHSKSCSAIDDAKKSEYVLTSASQFDSKEFASSIQKPKMKEATETPKHEQRPGLAQDCNLQFSTPQFLEAIDKASSSLFSSLPSMHMDMEHGQSSASISLEVTREGLFEHEGVCLFENPKLWSGSRFNNAFTGSTSRANYLSNERSKGCADTLRRKPFMVQWPACVVYEALEKGEAFRAAFHVNAHNRLEGYCTIDGVSTDILISGASAQNRAVEGDVVAIVVDPVSSWPRMKGNARKQSADSVGMKDATDVTPGVLDSVRENIEDELLGKDDCIFDDAYLTCNHPGRLVLNGGSPIELGNDNVWDLDIKEDDSCWLSVNGNICLDQAGNALASTSMALHVEARNFVNGGIKNQTSEQQLSCYESFDGQDEAGKAIANLITNVRARPNKRPIGRVVAIIDESPRRNAVIGFLEVKQWIYNKEAKGGCSRNEQSMKSSSKGISSASGGPIKLVPTDARFQKMVVHVGSLPDCLKKRLLDGDVTIESELVAARIDAWRPDNYLPLAVVTQSLGESGKIEAQTAAILIEHAIHTADFHPDALACLPTLPWNIPSEEFKKRRDLRELCIFSIDPPMARDLDDALSIQSIGNGVTRVGVHIADVSYFVLPETALDAEAQCRSTSVYLIQQVFPMLPRLLCEELCSLNPGVDRLAFSVMWDMDSSGEILDHWIGRTIIRSCCKLSYQHAQEIIDDLFDCSKITSCQTDWPELHGAFKLLDIIADIRSLHEIAERRRNCRFENGALRLDNSKLVFELDDDGMPCNSLFYEHKDSNFLVEEFMLLANMTVAKVISKAFPECALLRRHPEPRFWKFKELEAFCIKHGFELDTSSAGQLHLSLEKMREKLKNDPVLFNILVLYATKPMQLAKYFSTGELRDKENEWAHYALATPLYTHFTSPIRRYPDIVVHRTLAAALEAEETYFKDFMPMMKTGIQKTFYSENSNRCFTSLVFDNEAAESAAGKKSLAAAAFKHKVPGAADLALIAAHCNERKVASRNVRDASDKLYLWAFLKKKQQLFSDARVLALGPKFMSVYIHKLAMERRIYFDEIEGLIVEWFEATGVLLLDILPGKFSKKRRSNGKYRTLEDIALVVNPANAGNSSAKEEIYEGILCEVEGRLKGEFVDNEGLGLNVETLHDKDEIEPAVFPLTLRILSSVPISVHALEGDNMLPDIAVRLYLTSYLS